jgi:magnesium transporter
MEATGSKFYHFTASGLFYGVGSLKDAIEDLQEGGFVWFNLFRPTREELNLLVDVVGLHPLAVEDCFDDKQVPKIEYFTGNTFIIFNSFTYIEKTLIVDEIDLFIGKNFLITVSGNNSGDRKPLIDIAGIVENDPGNAKLGPAFLMHKVLDYVVDNKYKAFDEMEDELDEAEESLITNVEVFNPAQLIRLRKDLLKLRKSLFYEREILVKICRLDCPFITDKALAHYRDIYDHLSRFYELSETYREIETSLMELYTSLLNNLMTKVSNETNFSVRRLTMIATIFMPLTLIASIGGMSEWSMMTGPDNWKYSYPLFLIVMVIIAAINYFLIKRLERKNKYIQKD